MTERREKMLSRLQKSNPSEAEQKMIKLVIERICVDMAEFYSKFYAIEGPGAMVYVPDAEEDGSMFYLSLDCLMNALNDFNGRQMDGPADVMQKAISRAESLDPEKESLFIIQDKDQMSLIHYKHDNQEHSFLKM
jgi:hypothetical protein